MRSIDRRRIDDAIRGLAPLSNTAASILEQLEARSCSLADLREIIECDAPLTLRVLRMANVSAHALAERVETVDRAVAVIGERALVSVALASGASSLLSVPLEGYRLSGDQLLTGSLHGAVAARLLAVQVPGVAPTHAFTAGLLRDVGKVVMSALLAKRMPRSMSSFGALRSTPASDFLESERQLIGMDHCEVGYLVADHYGLSAAQHEVIAHHHRPSIASPEHQEIVDVVHVADLVAMMVGGAGGVDEMQYRFDHGAVMRLGLDPARLESLIVETLVEAESLLEMLRA
ncbi:MAG: HDOD domain-containing protein [Spirochaetaceae bacterium]|nr:HDOD domain-containing protein [Myxococcales bacterium]MCB9726400.1 HDOD domain-containing protein [Spirochaetaceae bacterium]HPG24680.1 HDOD domain-containing protein [Myxococcota bacterium]